MSDKPWFARAMPIVRLIVFCVYLKCSSSFTTTDHEVDVQRHTGCLWICSLVVLGASVHYINTTLHGKLFIDGIPVWPQAAPDGFSVLDLGAALLTLLVIKPMYVIVLYADL
jgi:hypothetical protein